VLMHILVFFVEVKKNDRGSHLTCISTKKIGLTMDQVQQCLVYKAII
jgi:hypothetical protein